VISDHYAVGAEIMLADQPQMIGSSGGHQQAATPGDGD